MVSNCVHVPGDGGEQKVVRRVWSLMLWHKLGLHLSEAPFQELKMHQQAQRNVPAGHSWLESAAEQGTSIHAW